MQFELGSFLDTLNLVVNEGFEDTIDDYGYPRMWNDIVSSTMDPTTDGVDQSVYHGIEGQSVTITGNSTQNKYFGQDIQTAGQAGSKIYLSGYSKAEGVSSTGGDYVLMVRVDYEDGTQLWYATGYSKTTHDWEFKDKTITVNKPFKSLGVYVKLENQTGKAWFDDITVQVKDVSKPVMSQYNIAENSSFEYDKDYTGIPDEWQPYNQTAGTIVIEGIDNAYVGEHAVSISNTTDTVLLSTLRDEPIRDGYVYTATAMVKTNSSYQGSGVLKFDLYNSAGSWLTQKKSEAITDTKGGWQRVKLILTAEEAKQLNANAARLKVTVGADTATTGTIYFDAVRFQATENSIISKISYDVNKNYITSITDPIGRVTSFPNIDARGNIKTVEAPKTGSNMDYNYTDLDQIDDATDAIGLKEDFQYDNNGNLYQVDYYDVNDIPVLESTVSMSYDELDRLITTTDANNKITEYNYDPNSNLTDVIYPNGKAINLQYDSVDRVENISYTGDSTTWGFQYDQNGNITQVTKNGTEVTDYTIDPDLDRINSVTLSSRAGKRHIINYGYDQSDRVNAITQEEISLTPITYEYGPAGFISMINGLNGIQVDYMHDESGRLKKSYIQVGEGYTTYYEYNEAGELIEHRQESAEGNIFLQDQYLYDDNGNIEEITHKDGAKELFEYDLADRLTREYHKNASGTIIRDISYTYDVMGNRKTKTENSVTTNYTYDDANQLLSVDSTSWSYDDNGTFDNGNVTSDGQNTYHYNAENQMTSVDTSSGTTSYEYDHEGRRTKKVTEGETEYYYYVGGYLSYIADGNNNVKYSFTRNPSGQLIAMTDHTGVSPENYFYELNAHGDVIGLKNSNGEEVVTYEYDAFGNVLDASGSVTTGDGKLLREANPFRYASYFYDEETGLYYLMSRYYNADVGRFMTRDTIPNKNLYVYAENNPVMYVDPSGYNPAAAIAGAYFIPGIGEVLLIGTVIVILGVATIYACSWIYNKAKDYVITAQNNKTIKKKIDSLNKRIKEHEEKIRKEPNSQARNHWEKEIRNWQNEIEKLKKKLRK